MYNNNFLIYNKVITFITKYIVYNDQGTLSNLQDSDFSFFQNCFLLEAGNPTDFNVDKAATCLHFTSM